MADSEQKKPLTKNQEKNEAKRKAKMEKFLAKQKKQQVIIKLCLIYANIYPFLINNYYI